MENFREVIEFVKKVRRETSDSECACETILLKDGRMEIFKLSHAVTANFIFTTGGRESIVQIEERADNRIAVYPPNGAERSVEACDYSVNDSLELLKNLKAEQELIDMLIGSLNALHERS